MRRFPRAVRSRRRKAGGSHLDRSRYAAAQISHLTGGWRPVAEDVNTLITNSQHVVRERVRQLVRDFPPFTRAADNISAYVVGTGVVFQSKVLDADSNPDRRTRTLIEDALKRAMDEIDISGSSAFRQHYYELSALAKRQDFETGEFIAVWQPHKNQRNKFIPWGISLYEADRLSDLGAKPVGKNKVYNGVEVDRAGRIVALHLADDGYSLKATRVPAENVVFGFDRQRPGQVRGMPCCAAAVLIAGSLKEAVGSELDAFKLASRYLAFVETPDPAGFQNVRKVGQGEDQDPEPIEYLENALIEYLRPGESIKLANNQRGDGAFQAFTKFMLQLTSLTTGTPYEMLTGDYSGLNYTTLRVSRNDFAQQMAPTVNRHVFQFEKPHVWRILEACVLSGRLNLPGYFTDPYHYRRGVFIPPGMRPIDPLKENKAAVEAIKAGLQSPQEIILARGGDPEAVLDDLREWQTMCDDRELVFDLSSISTANANNPAAVSGENGD